MVSLLFFCSLDVIEGSDWISFHTEPFLSSSNIEYWWKTFYFCYVLCENETVNVSFLIRPAIPGYYALMYKITVQNYFMLCFDILSVAFGYFFKVLIALTGVMPKAFSFEGMDNLEGNGCSSGSSYCFHCVWLSPFKHTTV